MSFREQLDNQTAFLKLDTLKNDGFGTDKHKAKVRESFHE